MSIPKIAKAMDYIDDDLVSGAIEYKRTKKKNTWVKWGSIAACLCIMVIGVFSIFPKIGEPVPNGNPVSDAPAHFYYKGSQYSYAGKLVYALPEGFELLGEVNNVGDAFTGVDMDGNVDGYVFMNDSDSSIAYFQWKEWNEDVDGKMPFLILTMDDSIERTE